MVHSLGLIHVLGIRWIAFAPPGRGKGLPTQFLFQVTPRTHNLATALSAPVVLVILAGRVVSLFVCLRCFGRLTLGRTYTLRTRMQNFWVFLAASSCRVGPPTASRETAGIPSLLVPTAYGFPYWITNPPCIG